MSDKLVRCQVLVSADPDVWKDANTLVDPDWIEKMNRDAGMDLIRVHRDDIPSAPRPQSIRFPVTPDQVRWMSGHQK